MKKSPGHPPKKWFDKMRKEVSKGNPSYSEERVNATVGSIWYHKLDSAKRSELLHEYEGGSKKAFENLAGRLSVLAGWIGNV